MQKADAAVWQQGAGGLGIILLDRFHPGVQFIFFNGRADDIDLMPGGDLLIQKAVHVPGAFCR